MGLNKLVREKVVEMENKTAKDRCEGNFFCHRKNNKDPEKEQN